MENTVLIGNPESKNTIIYLHGGGYVMGDANDLPKSLIDSLIDSDFKIIGLNYLLAPQVKHKDIVKDIESMINKVIRFYNLENYHLLGRSSGGNAILTINPDSLSTQPQTLILFYTYASVDVSWMSQPIRNLEYPINEALIKTINSDTEIVRYRPIKDYYGYYYSLRKKGIWQETLELDASNILWNQDIPAFIIHSIFDPDVPYRCALELKSYFVNNVFNSFNQKQHAIDHNLDIIDEIVESLINFLVINKEESV